ncbi:MAG: HAD family hydrolase [Anaerolineae bacterium]|nr:HAD family hydrolase [Anaerolineae bacterium]
MGAIKLIALDLDGTLMGEDRIITPRVRRAIDAAQEQGVVVTLATGRMFSFLVPIAHDLGITAPLISYQGGLIQAADATQPLYRATMDAALVREALEWQKQRQARIVLYADDAVFLTERQESLEFYQHMLGENLVWVDSLDEVLEHHEPIKIIFFVEPEEAEPLRAELEARFGGRMEVTRSHELIVECNPLGVSKGEALRRLAGHLRLSRSQVMAVGDQDNDIPMLQWAGIGVAMGNASPGLKAVADWIAPPLEEDGAAVAIERFVLGSGTTLQASSRSGG